MILLFEYLLKTLIAALFVDFNSSMSDTDSVSQHEEDSQESNLSSQELRERANESVPRNTRKAVQWAVETYRKWARRRHLVKFIKPDITDYGQDLVALDKALNKFYGEVHSEEGMQYTPSSLQVLRAGLQRHLSDAIDGMPVMAQHPAFRKSNKQFTAAKRRFAMNGNRAAGAAKQPMDPADQEKVRAYFANPKTYDDPTILQLFVYYMLSMTFGYRGREVWHQLRKDCFEEGRDELGRPIIRVDQALIEKNYQHTGPNTTCRRVNSVSDDPEAGVYLYSTLKLYLSKLDPRQPAFLQKAKTQRQMERQPDSQSWYVNAPMGSNTIDSLMPKISTAAGTPRRSLHQTYARNEHATTWLSHRCHPSTPPAEILQDLGVVHRTPHGARADGGNEGCDQTTSSPPPPGLVCQEPSDIPRDAGTPPDGPQQQQPVCAPGPSRFCDTRSLLARGAQELYMMPEGPAVRRDVPPPPPPPGAQELHMMPEGPAVCRDVPPPPPPPGAQELHQMPAQRGPAGHPFGLLPRTVIPLSEADLSRPPPAPFMPMCQPFLAHQKVFYGTFQNCTFN